MHHRHVPIVIPTGKTYGYRSANSEMKGNGPSLRLPHNHIPIGFFGHNVRESAGLKACPKSLYSPFDKGGKRRHLELLRHPLRCIDRVKHR